MNHFIIDFKVSIDKLKTQEGRAGHISETECMDNLIRETITRQYKKYYPQSQKIEVAINEIKKVSSTDYYLQSKNFMEIRL